MQITASLVKELREKTGAGMMDCKKALTECDGDINKAADWLRENGIAKSAKKAGRIAAEGLSRVLAEGNKAVLVEINSESDFVAKNDKFIDLLNNITKAILDNEPADNDAVNALMLGDRTVAESIVDATAIIGEKISFRRFTLVKKSDDEVFGTYMHNGGTISALSVVKGGEENTAKYIAMQVASMKPEYIDAAHMDPAVVEHETKVQKEILANDPNMAGKPEKMLENILKGKVSKALQDLCLVDQIYFMDQGLKVGGYLKNVGATVTNFVRFEVGEGMEHRVENFAEEVAKAQF